MDIRVKKLLEVFQSNGWAYIGSADVVSDWWFTEVLHLNSLWRPINTNLYLTLLTDPQDIKQKTIWCISVSSTLPNDRHFSSINQVTLNDINKIDLNQFVQEISKIVLA